MSHLPPPPPGSVTGTGALAAVWQRLLARLIDGLLIAGPFVLVILAQVDTTGDEPTVDVPLWLNFATLGVSAVYEIGLIAWRGQTVGKMALGIRVTRAADGGIPTLGQSAIRHLLPVAVAAIPFLLAPFLALFIYLRALWDPRRQGWHDKAAATLVLRTR